MNHWYEEKNWPFKLSDIRNRWTVKHYLTLGLFAWLCLFAPCPTYFVFSIDVYPLFVWCIFYSWRFPILLMPQILIWLIFYYFVSRMIVYLGIAYCGKIGFTVIMLSVAILTILIWFIPMWGSPGFVDYLGYNTMFRELKYIL